MTSKVKMIVAMFIFGTIGIFVKKIPLPTGEIVLFRAIIALISIIVYQLIRGKRIHLPKKKKDLCLLLISGAAVGFNWLLLFEAYHYTTVSIATLSYYFAPVLIMIACPILFKERMTARQGVCFVMATIGLVLIIGVNGTSGTSNHLIGIGLGLGAACLYATAVLLNKSLKEVEGIDRMIFQFAAIICVLVPYVCATSGIHLMQVGTVGILNLILIGVLHTGFAYCLYFSSLKELKGQEAAILSYIDPLVAVVASIFILGEGISGIQMVGGALILGFTLLNEVK